MVGINHALTGGLIISFTHNPAIGLPLALLSHFVLDSMPHFGEVFEKRKKLSTTVWGIDLTLVVIFLIILIVSQQWGVFLGAVVGMSPDFAWVYRFTVQEQFGSIPPRPENSFNRWHAAIQRFESKPGLIIDVLTFCLLVTILYGRL